MTLHPLETLLVAVLALLLGRQVNRLIPPLSRYNIPDPITGGLLFAVVMLLSQTGTGVQVTFDVTLKPVLLLAFFAAVGLSANLSMLRQGGKRLLRISAEGVADFGINGSSPVRISNIAGKLV